MPLYIIMKLLSMGYIVMIHSPAAQGALLEPPHNMSVRDVLSDRATLTWTLTPTPRGEGGGQGNGTSAAQSSVKGLEVMVVTLTDEWSIIPATKFFFQISSDVSTYTVSGLRQGVTYQCVIRAYGAYDAYSPPSERVSWTNSRGSDDAGPMVDVLGTLTLGALVVVLVLSTMQLAHNWWELVTPPHTNSIARPKYKNIQKIKIVNRAHDSVIYRNHTKKYNSVLVARQQKLHDMRTTQDLELRVIKEQPETLKEHLQLDKKARRKSRNFYEPVFV